MTMNWIIVRIRNTTAPDDQVAGDDEVAERADHLARVGAQQDEARRRHLQRQPEQRRQQQQRRERRDLQRVADVDRDQQQHHGRRDVDRDQQIEQRRRQRHDHHADDRDHQARQREVRVARQQRAHVARAQAAKRCRRCRRSPGLACRESTPFARAKTIRPGQRVPASRPRAKRAIAAIFEMCSSAPGKSRRRRSRRSRQSTTKKRQWKTAFAPVSCRQASKKGWSLSARRVAVVARCRCCPRGRGARGQRCRRTAVQMSSTTAPKTMFIEIVEVRGCTVA